MKLVMLLTILASLSSASADKLTLIPIDRLSAKGKAQLSPALRDHLVSTFGDLEDLGYESLDQFIEKKPQTSTPSNGIPRVSDIPQKGILRLR